MPYPSIRAAIRWRQQPSLPPGPNGFDPGSATSDLTNDVYYTYKRVPSDSGYSAALSYTYVAGVVDMSTTFFRQCLELPGVSGDSTNFSKRYASAGDQQNYANWYSYYRTRLLTTKTLAGRSFKALTGIFRVGFSTTSDTGATFLPINLFSGSQTDAFYSKLYGVTASADASPQRFTPLRGALSKAGRFYAADWAPRATTRCSTPANKTLP